MTTYRELALCLALTGTVASGAPPEATAKRRPNQPRAAAGGTRAFTREELPGPPLPEEAPIPQGSKADVFAWKQAIDLQNELVIRRKAAEELLRTFQRNQHDARLAKLIAVQTSEGARQRLHAIRKRLGYSWKAVSDLIAAPWPVDARLGCRAQVLDLESAMSASLGTTDTASLPDARLQLRACTRKVQGVIGPLQAADETFASALAAADGVLGTAAGVAGPDAGGPGPDAGAAVEGR